MKNFLKIISAALCITVILTALTACGDKPIQIGIDGIDVYTHSNSTVGPKLTATGENRIAEHSGVVVINVSTDVTDVELDLTKFFMANPKYKGKKFSFTRDDVRKGDNTLVKGYAWYQVGGDAGSRLYKKLGYENDPETMPLSKEAISAKPNREGEVRMYLLTSGTQTGKHIVYLDPTTGSNIQNGETRVTFKFKGHNGKKGELKVLVIKAAA